MANETLSIRKNQARLTVIGKSKADTYIDSGLGLDLGDLPSLDPFDLNWQIDVPDPDNLPDEIRIITPPTKLEYVEGEKIDISGAVVGAYKNGSIWTGAKYPNGNIPHEELIIDPLIAKIRPFSYVDDVDGIPIYVTTDETVLECTEYEYPGPQESKKWKVTFTPFGDVCYGMVRIVSGYGCVMSIYIANYRETWAYVPPPSGLTVKVQWEAARGEDPFGPHIETYTVRVSDSNSDKSPFAPSFEMPSRTVYSQDYEHKSICMIIPVEYFEVYDGSREYLYPGSSLTGIDSYTFPISEKKTDVYNYNIADAVAAYTIDAIESGTFGKHDLVQVGWRRPLDELLLRTYYEITTEEKEPGHGGGR